MIIQKDFQKAHINPFSYGFDAKYANLPHQFIPVGQIQSAFGGQNAPLSYGNQSPSNPNALYNAGTPQYSLPNPGNVQINSQGNLPSSSYSAPSGGGGTDYQAQWKAAGHAGTAPVGYHGESTGGGGGSGIGSNYNATRAAMQSGQIPWDDNVLSRIWQSDPAQQQQLAQQIENVFTPYSQYLSNLATNIIPQGAAESTQNVQNQYQSQVGLLPGQQQELLNPIQIGEQQVGQRVTSAADQALQAFRALGQQAQAGFGGQTSTGGALSELAQQEYLRGARERENFQNTAGLTFEGQRTQVANFIAQKHADLDNWLNEAKLSIQSNMRNQLGQINQLQALTEQQKQQAKLEALQNTVNQNRAIELADRQFRRQIELFGGLGGGGQSAAQIGGTQYNMQPFQNQLGYLLLNSQTPNVPLNFQFQNTIPQAQQLAGGIGQPMRFDETALQY